MAASPRRRPPRTPLAPYFSEALFSWQVGVAKPDRKIYELCASRLQRSMSSCLFVGDGGSSELQGARDAGMSPVFVKGLMPSLSDAAMREREEAASFVIDELRELVA